MDHISLDESAEDQGTLRDVLLLLLLLPCLMHETNVFLNVAQFSSSEIKGRVSLKLFGHSSFFVEIPCLLIIVSFL